MATFNTEKAAATTGVAQPTSTDPMDEVENKAPAEAATAAAAASEDPKAASAPGSSEKPTEMTSKDYYFDSYSHFGIHEEMLKDEVRTMSYMNAIEQNKHLFAGKVVMDVGCGTGILSMFAARAGAKQVIGIECSTIIEQARKIVAANGFADKITLIKSKCEDIASLEALAGVDKVDIIISEWMGYFLLYESMLDTVIYARDRWLKEGGLMLPDKATLMVGAIEDEQYRKEKIDFWDEVYGFDMSVIKEIALTEPLVDVVEGKAVVSDCQSILSLDLANCKKEELQFKSEFVLTARRNDFVHAIVAYFDCQFSQLHKPVRFSTGPFTEYTHWKQTVFYLRQPLTICKGERGDEAQAERVAACPSADNPRDLDITLRLDHQGSVMSLHATQEFRLR
ncbi:unnamed protein product [Scytosiphon promiscuus]